MRLKRLRLAGFKSFVEPAEMVIAPGLTGIVGPNGCGKSNLLEALRWTMGENSPRSMRGAGMEDVIFAGTATRPPRDFAEVSLVVELPNDAGGHDEAEIVRRIERGAGSAYRLDGRDVRARDVQLLFADAATGAHSPALVSQNRIGAVIAARPAERRAMLEEAAGIAGLHVRRKDAEARLRATEANLARLDEVLADADARAQALRRQARQAERYRALSQQVRTAEARLIFARWREAATAAEAARAEAGDAERRVAGAAEGQAQADAAVAAARSYLAAARADALAARDAAADLAHRLSAVRADKAAVERRIAELAIAGGRVAADRTREATLATDAAQALARLSQEVEALRHAIAQAEARRPELDAGATAAEARAGEADAAHARAQAAQAAEMAEARVARTLLATSQQRAERARREEASAAAALAAIGTAAPLEAERAAAAAARTAAERQLTQARDMLARTEAAQADARARHEAGQAARATARASLAGLDGEIAALARATRTASGARLLDRLTVAPGYERALAAALGDDLDAGTDAAADRHWAGTDPLPGDPQVPAGEAMAPHVWALPLLARRLSQVLVLEADDGRALLPGQRLVTRDGVMRRWDGFVVRGAGAAAAERLERANRLALLERQRPDMADALAQAESALAAAAGNLDTARSEGEAARRDAAAAENAIRAARQQEDRVALALERLEARRLDAAERAQRTCAERAEAEEELAAATARVAALPDTAGSVATLADAQRTAAAERATAAQARADRLALERDLAARRDRVAAAEGEARTWRTRAADAGRRLADVDERAREIAAEHAGLEPRPAALADELHALASASDDARAEADRRQLAERTAETQLRDEEARTAAAAGALATAREARAAAATRLEGHELRRVELGRVSGERFECPAPVLPERLGFAPADVRTPAEESGAHERLVAERERIGPVNLLADQELARLEGDCAADAAQRDELGQAVHRLRGSIGVLNREGRQRLLATFEAVRGNFRDLFAHLFDGGQAQLELVDSDDPLEAGLEILAQPPGKRLQSLTLLSGGEQALTAVALIFALFLTNPAPVCVLDEVDAPLDDANIDRFCGLLDRMSRDTDTRYLIVTHNAVTMSRMHRLFGVTMVEKGVSRLVSVDLQAAETLVNAA